MTITEFLLARIAEDEAAARAILPGLLIRRGPEIHPGESEGFGFVWTSPDRVLAECEAKRRIVQDCVEFDDEATSGAALGHRVLRALAFPYADHPDYQQEWRP